VVFWACFKLIHTLSQLDWGTWVSIFGSTSATFLRVIGSLIFSSLWAVPLGLWIGLSPKRTRIAQPIVQILASFPTPMLYPLVLKIFFSVGIGLNLSSMFLMMLGVQWYILFNVIAGALRISQELNYTTRLMQTTNYDRWRVLYLPSIFPALVTGWITAAGGAWNASIVAEYLSYQGQTLTAYGLGSLISHATNIGDMTLLAASLTVMISFVVLINRTFWAKIYNLAQSRYRLD
jgi:NitT/TauT family transport system permease protein